MPGTALEKLVYISQTCHNNLFTSMKEHPHGSHGKHMGSEILNYFGGLKAQVSPLTLHLKISECLFSHFSKWERFPPTRVVIGCD